MNITITEQAWMDTHHKPGWQRGLARAQRKPRGKTMAINKDLKIEVGDEFRDMDPRSSGQRVVKVIAVQDSTATIETIATPPENSKAIGRKIRASKLRLSDSRQYQKVSR